MIATLFVTLCVGALCHTDGIAEMPWGACVTQAGLQQAMEYAEKRGETFQGWKCEVGRRA